MKNLKLAVISPHIGVISETFILRHMMMLAPEQTVIIVNDIHPSCLKTSWEHPIYKISDQWRHLHYKAFRFLAKKLHCWRPSHQLLPAKKFLLNNQVDILLGEYLDHTHPWISIAQDLNIPIYAHAHGYDVSTRLLDKQWRVDYLAYNSTKGVITVSDYSRKKLISIGLQPDKIHVIPCGVDTPLSPPKKLKSDKIHCLMTGRLTPKKAPLISLESFRLASKKNKLLQLDIIGDGVLKTKTIEYIQKHDLSSKVKFHGSLPNNRVLQFMKNADIFIQHSITDPITGDEEGMPVAILEAMAQATPVISTKHAGIPEAVINRETGVLVKEKDSLAMADAISELASDYHLRISTGTAGWERAREYFSWEEERLKLKILLSLK